MSTNPPSLETRLRSDFTTLAHSLNASAATTQKWTNELIQRYTEPHRHYHTLTHISSMLASLSHARHLVKQPTVVALAIFFHDWIYDPTARDNEMQSVQAFRAFGAEVGVAEGVGERVAEFVRCTIGHRMPVGGEGMEGEEKEVDGDLELFLDFDLQVLARGREEYEVYAEGIREEYGCYSDGEYWRGRIKVLKGFLERERLFFSEGFYERFEGVARENLKWEIENLESKVEGLEGVS